MKFTAWEQKRSIERKYRNAFHKLADWLGAMIPDDEPSEAETLDILQEASQSPALASWADAVADTMVTQTLEENARTWRQAAAISSRGREMYEALQDEMQGPVGDRVRELIQRNAQYITSLPLDVAQEITKTVASEAYADNRSAYTGQTFKQMVGNMTEAHAKLISHTETAKAHAALTQARAEYLGRDWYVWRTTKNMTVRASHRIMEDVLCRWSDPPAPEELAGEKKTYGHYHPGNIFNCHCYAETIIVATQIVWPHKVYSDGAIQTMTQGDFKSVYGKVGD